MPRFATDADHATEPVNRSRAKRKRVEDDMDEEIDSDEAEGMGMDSDDESIPEHPDATLEDANETVEEKRLRLAKDYLRQLGVGDEADAAESGSGSDSEADGVNARLRDTALKNTGRVTTPRADDIARAIPGATVSAHRGHALPPTCVALASRDEGVAVTGGKDARVIIWDVGTGSKLHALKAADAGKHKRHPARAKGHVGNVLSVAVTHDGALAASGGSDGLVRVWDLRTGKLVESLRGHRGAVTGLSFHDGTRSLLSASADRTVKSWDLGEMAYVETLFGHGGSTQAVATLPSERALSAGQDGSVRLYKIVEGSQLVFRRPLTSSVDCVAALASDRFVSGGDDGAIALWHTSKKKPVASVADAHGEGRGADAWVASVAACPFSDVAMSGGGDGKIRFWKCGGAPPTVEACGVVDVGPGFVNGIAVGGEGKVVVAAVGAEHRLGRWSRVKGAKNGIRIVRLG